MAHRELESSQSRILGIETSCDECSVSVIDYRPNSITVLSVATFSQIEIHRPYGGVVPEIASRNHLETINTMLEQALKQADVALADLAAIAVTNRPGLVGGLLVGVSAAKAIAYAAQKPLIPVHHLEGHAVSIYLDQPQAFDLELPLLLAVVSGGHTNLYVIKVHPELWPLDQLKRSLIARTRDDAAGEAFDKTAKLMGYPYPGGVWIDQTAKSGNPSAYAFPRALPQKTSFDFSFSGLKTAVALEVASLKSQNVLEQEKPNLCASIQEAIVDSLVTKMFRAAKEHGCHSLALVGGVAANSRLRERLTQEWPNYGLRQAPFYPKLEYCTDNAAMIAAAGAFRFRQGLSLRVPESLSLNAIANPEI